MNVLKKGRFNWARNEFAMLAIIIVATVLLMGILNPSRFFRITNLQSMAYSLWPFSFPNSACYPLE